MKLHTAQFVSAMPLLKIYGDNVQSGAAGFSRGVWPEGYTNAGSRAEAVMIRPEQDTYLGADMAVAGDVESDGGFLAADVEYVFPLHPSVEYLYLFPTGASSVTQIRWMVLK